MPAWLETSVTVLTLIVMLIGLFGLIVPIFPGLVIIWLAALGYGLIVGGFTTTGWILFGIITMLMIVGNVLDGVLMGAKALEHGASKRSIVYALVAGIGVSLVLSPLGGLIAAPTALYLSEKSQGRTEEEARATTRGLMTGWGWSFILRFVIGIAMIILWVIWA